MKKLSPIYTEKTECQDCYKCLRACPIKSIGVAQGAATILVDECVFCGECTRVCPAKAKRIRDDLPAVRQALAAGETLVVSLAPAFACEFAGISLQTLTYALMKVGFSAVSETAHGADRLSYLIIEEIKRKRDNQKLFISTACPAIVRYIQRHNTPLIPYLVENPSPLHLHALALKDQTEKPIRVVFVGPCAAKKCESDEHRDVIDFAISFSDVVQLFKEANLPDLKLLQVDNQDVVFDRPSAGLYYPIDSGMIKSLQTFQLKTHIEDLSYVSASGLQEVIDLLKNVDPTTLEAPLFLELLACPSGCVNGPLMRTSTPMLNKQIQIENEAKRYGKAPNEMLQSTQLMNWQKIDLQQRIPTVDDITQALHEVGKFTPENELNCSGCGYDSCRDFATALALGKAEKTMCVSYMRALAQKKAAGLMRSMPSGVAIINAQGEIIESNQQFAKLLGDTVEEIYNLRDGLDHIDIRDIIPEINDYVQNLLNTKDIQHIQRVIQHEKKVFHVTLFVIETQSVVGIILQDTTKPFIQRDRVIEQARTMIDKHLATVQNIAFLLGENAAESEAILNNMIQTFSAGQEHE